MGDNASRDWKFNPRCADSSGLQAALNDKKREIFEMLAATYRKLASDIEAVIATNAILDEERDKRLIGLLGKDDNPADSLTEIAKLLGQSPEEPE